jgi:uncharacterized repeat protein (TIGR03803 family)
MKTSKYTFALGLALAAFTFTLAVCAQAQTFSYIAKFNGNNGKQPVGALVQATDGNFYGASGTNQEFGGQIFRVTPTGEISTLYEFCLKTNCPDGSSPESPILGSDGNLYGATSSGGVKTTDGTIYKLTLQGKLTTLHSFCTSAPCSDGAYPTGIVLASDGNFYGTTNEGGANNDDSGTLFRVSPTGEFKVLYTFCSQPNCTDGSSPAFPPMQGRDGNFYGATFGGGALGGGVLYRITPAGDYKVLYNFSYSSRAVNAWPTSLVEDADGNFFGTTATGGSYNSGSVYEFSSQDQLTLLHGFVFGGNEDAASGVILANDGNLYGVAADNATFAPNSTFGQSSIFQVTPAGVFTSLFTSYNGMNGPPVQATDGNFYGSTNNGGVGNDGYGDGTIFKLSMGLSSLVNTVPLAGKVGQTIIILGNNLTGSTSVTFNGVAAEFTVESDTYIKATVPMDATTGAVSVVTPTGTLNSNPQFVVTK